MLQKSKVMNREQISLREVLEEPELDTVMETDEFEADENGNTQVFLQIRDLVSKGQSVSHIIENESFNPLPVAGICDFVNILPFECNISILKIELMKWMRPF